MARHRAAPEIQDTSADGNRVVPDSGRLSRRLVGAVIIALVLFVGGAVWAVTSPSRGEAPPPAPAPNTGALAGAGTSAEGTPSGYPSGTASRRPTASPGDSLSPTPVASSAGAVGPPTASPSAPAPAPVTASLIKVNSWSPNNIQYRVVVTAGPTAITGWQATLTCAPDADWRLVLTSSWNIRLVASTDLSVTFANLSWNGAVAAGGWTDFGIQVTWGPASQPAVTTPNCTVTATTG